jgi:hypothetical protein
MPIMAGGAPISFFEGEAKHSPSKKGERDAPPKAGLRSNA